MSFSALEEDNSPLQEFYFLKNYLAAGRCKQFIGAIGNGKNPL